MRLVLFGATGKLGQAVLSAALARGHTVVAIVRTLASVSLVHERLELIQANVTDHRTYAAALAGADAVLGTLGTRGAPKHPVTLCTDWARELLLAMAEHRIRRVLAVTAGAYVKSKDSPLLFRFAVQPVILRVLRHTYADLQQMEAVLAQSSTEWTVVRPARLTDGARTGRARVTVEGAVPGGWIVSRADVAELMLESVERRMHVGERVAIAE